MRTVKPCSGTHACRFGFEGIVSKRLSAPYRSGPSRDWIKVKNPDSPATQRARERRW
jgi:bifunctional non-homologous end joining protein LigD